MYLQPLSTIESSSHEALRYHWQRSSQHYIMIVKIKWQMTFINFCFRPCLPMAITTTALQQMTVSVQKLLLFTEMPPYLMKTTFDALTRDSQSALAAVDENSSGKTGSLTRHVPRGPCLSHGALAMLYPASEGAGWGPQLNPHRSSRSVVSGNDSCCHPWSSPRISSWLLRPPASSFQWSAPPLYWQPCCPGSAPVSLVPEMLNKDSALSTISLT